MSPATRIHVPRETVSDDYYLIVEFTVQSGAQILEGEVIAALETSKAVFEVAAPCNGYLFFVHSQGDRIQVGSILAVVSDDPSFPTAEFQADTEPLSQESEANEPEPRDGGPRISKPAARLIAFHELDPKLFDHLSLVTRDDVESFLARDEKDPTPTEGRSFPKNAILLFGGGGHGKMCIDLIRRLGTHEIAGILDGNLVIGTTILDVPVIGDDSDTTLVQFFANGVRYAVNAFGAAMRHADRAEVFRRLKSAGFELPHLIHPHATVEPSANLGEGTQVFAKAVVGSGAEIGKNCIINSGAVVSHDCILGDNVHIAPGALLAGHVSVGKNTLVGMGASVFIKVRIGCNVLIANGVSLFKDLPDGATQRA